MMQSQRWKQIYDLDYVLSDHGNIQRLGRQVYKPNLKIWQTYKPRILKPSINRGYLRVQIGSAGCRKNYLIHRLVAINFVYNPNPDKFKIVNHKDTNKLNPHWTNLEWTDADGNIDHAIDNGLGINIRKLTAQQVRDIRNMFNGRDGLYELSDIQEKYWFISPKTIEDILSQRTWKKQILHSDLKLIKQ